MFQTFQAALILMMAAGCSPLTRAGDPPAAAAAAEEAKGAANAASPWTFDHEYRFSWIKARKKVGESRFVVSEVDAPTGSPTKKIYRSRASYWYKQEAVAQEGTHESYFDLSWRPLRYKAHHQMSGLRDYRSQQDQEGQVKAGRLIYYTVHNNDVDTGVRSEIAVPPQAYLLLNQSFDNWAILAGQVLRLPSACDVQVLFPDFLRVYDVHFAFEKEEALDLGKTEKPLCRLYSFRSKEGQMAGKVWMDSRNLMVQYQQGDLRIQLEE